MTDIYGGSLGDAPVTWVQKTTERDMRELAESGGRIGVEIRTPITKVLLAEVIVERIHQFELQAKVFTGRGRELHNMGFSARGAKAMTVCLDAMVGMLAMTLEDEDALDRAVEKTEGMGL